MGKKPKRSRQTLTSETPSASSTPTTVAAIDDNVRPAPALRNHNELSEDPYEDLNEDSSSYEDVYESSGDEEEPALAADDGQTDVPLQSWNPFQDDCGDLPLEMDESAYKMHHALTPDWPSLTLDILPDRTLGDCRRRFPHVVTMVVGSQANSAQANKLTVMRMSDLGRIPNSHLKTEKELDDEMLGEEWKHEDSDKDDDDNSQSSSEDEEELEAVLEHYSFPHVTGGINRVRVCPQNSDIVAVWSDAGVVSLYDIGGALDLLDRSLMGSNSSTRKRDNLTKNTKDGKEGPTNTATGISASNMHVRKLQKEPFFVYSGHKTEGYAIDWSRVVPGRLATADCHGNIHIWNATHSVIPEDSQVTSNNKRHSSLWGNSSFNVKHTYSPQDGGNLDNPSIEDLQWSPNEGTVLASAECGGYIKIYDVRCPNRAMITNKIHENGADVNVISWNRLVCNLLASGGDDGSFCVWDLRNFQTPDSSQSPKPLARFHCHRTPITSLEWHPTDESMIVVSDDRGTYIYDLSIEEDDPEQSANGVHEVGIVDGVIPPQLLFVHSGSEMTKEVHWHPQIPSCVATTSLSGFSVFIPSNL